MDIKNQFRIESLADPTAREPATKVYIDETCNDPSIIKNTANFDSTDKNVDNTRIVKVSSMPAVGKHLTVKYFVDQAIFNSVDEPILMRTNQDNDCNDFNRTNINSITLDTQANNKNQVITKSYVDHFHQENKRYQRDMVINSYKNSGDPVKKSK